MTPSAELRDWQSAGNSFDFSGRQIFYRDAGSGETLLLIHGFPTASWDWHKVWTRLTDRFRVIAPDMLGFGFSDKPVGHDYRLIEQADLHETLCVRLGIKGCHVLAHDYGVSVAQELLARQDAHDLPMQIQSIAFLNGGLFPESHQPRFIQKLLIGPIGPLLSRLIGFKQFRRSLSAVFGPSTQPSDTELQDFWYLIQQQNGNRLMHRLIRYMIDRQANRDRWLKPMQRTDVPMRLINGPLDPVSGAHLAHRYCELIPNPDYVSLPGIGHYPQVEAPEEVLNAYLDFVDKVRGS